MTTTDTAAVQSLTAEVYVLYIGDRQITQSVAKQLDEADPGDLEPFGRVRLTGKGFDEGEWIIGRDDHGNLRIADYGQLGRCHVSNIPLHVWLREGYRETPQLLTDAWRHWTLTSPRSEEDILILTSPDLCRIKAARSAVTVHRPISIFEIQDDIDSGVINEGERDEHRERVDRERYDRFFRQEHQRSHRLAEAIVNRRLEESSQRDDLEALPLIVMGAE